MNLKIKTERLVIQPYDSSFLESYFTELTDEITKYQYPDSFLNKKVANEVMSQFAIKMEKGHMLELVILSHDGEFLGSLEAFETDKQTPELGLWLKKSVQGKGYGYEALKGFIDYLNAAHKYQYYIYEVDIRNTSSIHLVEKFHCQKCGYEEVTTQSGKELHLQTYHILSE